MKYIDHPATSELNVLIDSIDYNQARCIGRLEIYSCKETGKTDRRLKQFLKEHDTFKDELRNSKNPQLKKLMRHLIATLNMSFPDYDFSATRPSQFKSLDIATALSELHSHLPPALHDPFSKSLVHALKEADLSLRGSCWEWIPHDGEQPDSDGLLHSTYMFFVTRVCKRVAFMRMETFTLPLETPYPSDDESDNNWTDTPESS